MKNYLILEKKFARIAKLNQMYEILSWDEQVNMPSGSSESRAQVLSEAKLMEQEILLAPDMSDLLNNAANETLDQWQLANLKAMNKCYLNAQAVPAELNSAWIKAIMKSNQVWRELRAKNDWQNFIPAFKEVVNISKQRGESRAATFGVSVYDALLMEFQEDFNTATIDKIFNQVKSWLPELITQVIAKQDNFIVPRGTFPIATQKALGLDVMRDLGFDSNYGRLDISHHPFCGGVPSDVRITTRYSESNFSQSLMGIIHETGHASYEQGLPRQWEFQPVGKSLGMSIHEGQSLLFEMQVGRSDAFLHYLTPKIQHYFGNSAELSKENLIKLYHWVKPGYIRVDADEVTYPAHVILRYEIEQELMAGKLMVGDIPEIWNEKMQASLGLSTKGNYKDGCMQDVHWPSGLFGYFPSYALGAIIAAQLFSAIKTQHVDLDTTIAKGDLSQFRNWLAKNVWSRASSVTPKQLIVDATGEELNVRHFEQHLRARYL